MMRENGSSGTVRRDYETCLGDALAIQNGRKREIGVAKTGTSARSSVSIRVGYSVPGLRSKAAMKFSDEAR